jgi:hypothetical protein
VKPTRGVRQATSTEARAGTKDAGTFAALRGRMIRCVLFALAFLAAPRERASAQDTAAVPTASAEIASVAIDPARDEVLVPADLAYAHYLVDVGMGLTLGGAVVNGAGLAATFLDGGLAGAAGGGTFAGIGGMLALAGIPMWIVGSVRSHVLEAAVAERSRVAWEFELAGMVTTLVSVGVVVVGAGLLVAALIVGATFHGPETSHEPMAATGIVLMPVGAFVALFIGTPLWSEGARF